MHACVWPVRPRDPLVSASPALGFQDCATLSSFLHACWGSELRSSCLCASTLLTEPPPQAQCSLSKPVLCVFLTI